MRLAMYYPVLLFCATFFICPSGFAHGGNKIKFHHEDAQYLYNIGLVVAANKDAIERDVAEKEKAVKALLEEHEGAFDTDTVRRVIIDQKWGKYSLKDQELFRTYRLARKKIGFLDSTGNFYTHALLVEKNSASNSVHIFIQELREDDRIQAERERAERERMKPEDGYRRSIVQQEFAGAEEGEYVMPVAEIEPLRYFQQEDGIQRRALAAQAIRSLKPYKFLHADLFGGALKKDEDGVFDNFERKTRQIVAYLLIYYHNSYNEYLQSSKQQKVPATALSAQTHKFAHNHALTKVNAMLQALLIYYNKIRLALLYMHFSESDFGMTGGFEPLTDKQSRLVLLSILRDLLKQRVIEKVENLTMVLPEIIEKGIIQARGMPPAIPRDDTSITNKAILLRYYLFGINDFFRLNTFRLDGMQTFFSSGSLSRIFREFMVFNALHNTFKWGLVPRKKIFDNKEVMAKFLTRLESVFVTYLKVLIEKSRDTDLQDIFAGDEPSVTVIQKNQKRIYGYLVDSCLPLNGMSSLGKGISIRNIITDYKAREEKVARKAVAGKSGLQKMQVKEAAYRHMQTAITTLVMFVLLKKTAQLYQALYPESETFKDDGTVEGELIDTAASDVKPDKQFLAADEVVADRNTALYIDTGKNEVSDVQQEFKNAFSPLLAMQSRLRLDTQEMKEKLEQQVKAGQLGPMGETFIEILDLLKQIVPNAVSSIERSEVAVDKMGELVENTAERQVKRALLSLKLIRTILLLLVGPLDRFMLRVKESIDGFFADGLFSKTRFSIVSKFSNLLLGNPDESDPSKAIITQDEKRLLQSLLTLQQALLQNKEIKLEEVGTQLDILRNKNKETLQIGTLENKGVDVQSQLTSTVNVVLQELDTTVTSFKKGLRGNDRNMVRLALAGFIDTLSPLPKNAISILEQVGNTLSVKAEEAQTKISTYRKSTTIFLRVTKVVTRQLGDFVKTVVTRIQRTVKKTTSNTVNKWFASHVAAPLIRSLINAQIRRTKQARKKAENTQLFVQVKELGLLGARAFMHSSKLQKEHHIYAKVNGTHVAPKREDLLAVLQARIDHQLEKYGLEHEFSGTSASYKSEYRDMITGNMPAAAAAG